MVSNAVFFSSLVAHAWLVELPVQQSPLAPELFPVVQQEALATVSFAHVSSSLSQQLAAQELIGGFLGFSSHFTDSFSVAQQDDIDWAPVGRTVDLDAQQLPLND